MYLLYSNFIINFNQQRGSKILKQPVIIENSLPQLDQADLDEAKKMDQIKQKITVQFGKMSNQLQVFYLEYSKIKDGKDKPQKLFKLKQIHEKLAIEE